MYRFRLICVTTCVVYFYHINPIFGNSSKQELMKAEQLEYASMYNSSLNNTTNKTAKNKEENVKLFNSTTSSRWTKTTSVSLLKTEGDASPTSLAKMTTSIPTTSAPVLFTKPKKRKKISISELELNRPYKKIDKFLAKSEFYRKRYDKKYKIKSKTRTKTDYLKNIRRPIVADVDKNRPIIKDRDELEDCPKCRQLEMTMVQMQINRRSSLKRQLLQKLRLENAPKLKEPPAKLPKKLLQRFFQDDESKTEEDTFYAKTVEAFIVGHDVTRTCAHRKSTGCFKFDYKNKLEGQITSAELLVYKFRDGNDGQQTILVSELEKSGRRKLRPLNMVTRIETDIKEGWVSFPLDKTVRRWLAEPEIWSGALAIKCKTCVQTKHRNIFGAKGVYRPVLVIRVQPESKRRPKRGLECDVGTDMCCKKDYYITFHDLEMYRILQPRGIWANYCTGSCNVAMTGHYNHTRLIQGVRWRDENIDENLRAALQPCCGPVVLNTLSVLYVDGQGDIRRSHVPNLAIEECGCL